MAELPSVGSLIVPCQTTITLTDLESLRLISVYGLAGRIKPKAHSPRITAEAACVVFC